MEASPEPVADADRFAQAANRMLQDNLTRSAAFERRAFGLLSTVTAALTFLLAVLGLADVTPLNPVTKVAGTLGLGLLVVSAGCAVYATHSMKVRLIGPDRLTELWNDQKQSPDQPVPLTVQLIEDAVMPSVDERGKDQPGTVASAHAEAERRGKWVNFAVWTLLAALVCLGCTAISMLWVRM